MSTKNNRQNQEDQKKKKRVLPILLGLFATAGVAAGGTLIGLALTRKPQSTLHTITFNVGDAMIIEGSNTSTFDNSTTFGNVNKPKLLKDGKVFEGWYKSSTFTEENKFKDTDTINQNTTVYANLVADTNKYLLFTTSESGVTISGNTKIALDGKSKFSTYNKPTVKFSDGRVFDYWLNGTEQVKDDDVLTSTTSLTPHGYNPLEGKVTLTYKLTAEDTKMGAYIDGLASYTIETGFEFAKCTKPTAFLIGKMFDKWVDADGKDIPATIDKDTIVYAKFKDVDVEEKTYMTIGADNFWLTNETATSGNLVFANSKGNKVEWTRDEFNEKITIGSNVKNIPNNFLFNCSKFNQPISLPTSLETIGDAFMSGCKLFNQSIDMSSCTKLTKIGNSFLQKASAFNQTITFSDSIESIGYCFMYDCYEYNNNKVALTLPNKLTTISSSFLEGCENFNVEISGLSNITRIGAYFLARCSSFNKALTFKSDAELGDYFLYYCVNYNSVITLPTSLTTIPNNFLYECRSFNPTSFSMPTSVTSIGDNFMYDCLVFNKSFTIPAKCKIGAYFLNFNKAFSQSLTIPKTTVSIGKSFMYYCSNVTAITINCTAEEFLEGDIHTFATGNNQDACIKTGITVTATDKTNILKKFTNSTTLPFRYLV